MAVLTLVEQTETTISTKNLETTTSHIAPRQPIPSTYDIALNYVSTQSGPSDRCGSPHTRSILSLRCYAATYSGGKEPQCTFCPRQRYISYADLATAAWNIHQVQIGWVSFHLPSPSMHVSVTLRPLRRAARMQTAIARDAAFQRPE